jgi:hypothetical protein
VEVGPGHLQDFLEVGPEADQVHHGAVPPGGGAPQGEAQEGPQVVLELAGLRPLNGPVAGVVDPGGYLVEKQFLTHLEDSRARTPT